MNGEMAQLIRLATIETLRLTGRYDKPWNMADPTFQFCAQVDFIEPTKILWVNTGFQLLASDPEAWHTQLVKQGAIRAFVRHEGRQPEDRMLSAFSNGGRRLSLCIEMKNGRVDEYAMAWQIGDRNAADRRIWKVAYARMQKGVLMSKAKPKLDEAHERLRGALQEITNFCQANKETFFVQWFQRASRALAGEAVELPQGGLDWSPMPPKVGAVLNAVQHSWVFGGMGSWNDLSFDDQARYHKVSEDLYMAIYFGVEQAVNAV